MQSVREESFLFRAVFFSRQFISLRLCNLARCLHFDFLPKIRFRSQAVQCAALEIAEYIFPPECSWLEDKNTNIRLNNAFFIFSSQINPPFSTFFKLKKQIIRNLRKIRRFIEKKNYTPIC